MSFSSGSMGTYPLPGDGEGKPSEEPITELDNAYRERNRMVAFLAAEYPSTFIPGADPKWPDFAIVFVNFPHGQASWNIPPRDFDLFDFIPHAVVGSVEWDGHTTEEKHELFESYTRLVYTARMVTGTVGSIGEGYMLQKLPDMDKIALMCLEEHEGSHDRILWVGEDVNSPNLREAMEAHAQSHREQ